MLIHDAQYTPSEFAEKAHWGHCTIEYAVKVAREAGRQRLVLFHHDPSHGDDLVDRLLAEARVVAGGAAPRYWPPTKGCRSPSDRHHPDAPGVTPDTHETQPRRPARIVESIEEAADLTRQGTNVVLVVSPDAEDPEAGVYPDWRPRSTGPHGRPDR